MREHGRRYKVEELRMRSRFAERSRWIMGLITETGNLGRESG